MAAPHYRRVHLKLEGWFLNPEVERVQGVDRAAGVGECGFPGCMLPDKHAGKPHSPTPAARSTPCTRSTSGLRNQPSSLRWTRR